MEKKELANILSEILIPIGFKKKSDYWVIDGNEFTKMINLQKSRFSNIFYINYGYIIKSIPLNSLTMHIFQGLGSDDNAENTRIKELLNLENNISNEDRANELKKFLFQKVVPNFQAINTETDLLKDLKLRPHLNDIPLIVKKHFNLNH